MGPEDSAGATPLDPDEAEGLIPDHITTQQELNDWEGVNIAKAVSRALGRKRPDVLTEPFVRLLHRWMFDETWRWAGKYRTTGKNIGSEPHQIPGQVRDACNDARFWQDRSTYPIDEIAVRLHHRMVSVHPFPNGNGRHARLLADVLLHQHDAAPLTWGRSQRGSRDSYLKALRNADKGSYELLLSMART